MTSKTSRLSRRLPDRDVAVVNPPVLLHSPAPPGPSFFRDTPLGRLQYRAFRACAALQMAVVLLSLFTSCLVLATLLESAYSARVARELVYGTWWFALLLTMLAVNVLCAALKKYPWKRHQTGFLITHAGLITLVFGGLLSVLAGTEGQMFLIDTDNRDLQQTLRLPNTSDTIQLADQHQLEIYQLPRHRSDSQRLRHEVVEAMDDGVEVPEATKQRLKGHHWVMSFNPGPFAWYADGHFRPDLPAGLRLLHALARPAPGLARDLDDKGTLTVQNYYPHTEQWPFRPSPVPGDGFPAMKLRLVTPMMPRPLDRWLCAKPAFERDPIPVGFDLMVLEEPGLLDEFRNPPTEGLGKQGQLVLLVGREKKRVRVPVEMDRFGESIPLGDTGLTLRFKKLANLMDFFNDDEKGHHKGHGQGPHGQRPHGSGHPGSVYPTLEFEIAGPKGIGQYLTCARLPHMPPQRGGADHGPVAAWFHFPDFRWGNANLMGMLQFLKVPGGRVYYRVYGKDGLKEPGRELDADDHDTEHVLPFKPMELKFQVAAYLPDAVGEASFVPVNVRPGSDADEGLQPALRCELRSGGRTEEFWVRLSRLPTQVRIGEDLFLVRYRADSKKVDFALTLKKAQQVTDPGSSRPAWFQSDVVLSYESGDKKQRREQSIYMNHTLDYGQYKVYQANYRPMTDPETTQLVVDEQDDLVSLSGLTVAYDPGLWFKYVGSLTVVLGIVVMFYMRAYFFKPRSA